MEEILSLPKALRIISPFLCVLVAAQHGTMQEAME
jgi:hypothetical protein